MGSGASALSGSANYLAEVKDGAESSAGLELWDVERVAESLERDADLASLAPYARALKITGAAALRMDEAKLEFVLQDVDDQPPVAPRALFERIQAAIPHSEPKSSTRSDKNEGDNVIIGSDGMNAPPADAIPIGHDPLTSLANTNDESLIEECGIIANAKEDDNVDNINDDKTDNTNGIRAKYDDADEKNDRDHRSFKAQYDPVTGRSFFAAFDFGVLNSKFLNGSEDGDKKCEYTNSAMIVYGGETIGEIIKRLGKGGMGAVYELRLASGKSVAAKSVRADLKPAEQTKLEKSLAREVAIGFSAARGPQIASVIRVLIPLPGVETTIAGLLVLCDLVDGGDLEEAMHSGERKRNGELKDDYSGKLYTEHGAKTWPLASITLQIMLGLNHLHEHGIIHQVGESGI